MSGGHELGRWIMEGEHLEDVVHVADAALRAQARVDALVGEECVEVGDVGTLGMAEAK